MEDIKKAIEKEVQSYQNTRYKILTGEEKIIASGEFRNGALFTLSKWEESERWRKVEEELPEKGVEVIVTRTDGIRMLAWLDEDSEPFFNVSWNAGYFIDDIHSWKPIH